jgi:hypothetical protein
MPEEIKILDSKKMTERELQNEFVKYLKSIGVEEIVEELQYVSGGGICDVVYIDEKRNFVCVELKLKDWKRVIRQAIEHRRYADLIYIAMPEPKNPELKKRIECAVRAEELGLHWFSEEKGWFGGGVPHPKLYQHKHDFFSKSLQSSFWRSKMFSFIARAGENMKGLTETVARALCMADLTEPIKELSDEEANALDYTVDFIRENFLSQNFSKEQYGILFELATRESRKPNRRICRQFEINLTEAHWPEYKPFAEVAIKAYDDWLEQKKEESTTQVKR